MAELKNTDGFHLHGWMVNELHLNGGELFIYAVIHQFSQSDAGIYKGGVPYLCRWTGWSPNTIRKYLRILEQAGLIKSERGDVNGVPFCNYKVVLVPTLQNLKDTPQELEDNPSKSDVPTLQNLSGEKNNRNRKGNNNTEFKESLLSLGVSEEVAEAWMSVRKTKRATNTEIAFRKVAEEIQKSGKTAEECITIAVENSWQGFKAEWLTSKSHSRQTTPFKKEDKPFSFNKHF